MYRFKIFAGAEAGPRPTSAANKHFVKRNVEFYSNAAGNDQPSPLQIHKSASNGYNQKLSKFAWIFQFLSYQNL